MYTAKPSAGSRAVRTAAIICRVPLAVRMCGAEEPVRFSLL